MRKFLVVLLILSVMGGAFAQDEDDADEVLIEEAVLEEVIAEEAEAEEAVAEAEEAVEIVYVVVDRPRGNWGTFTGSAGISTTIDFYNGGSAYEWNWTKGEYELKDVLGSAVISGARAGGPQFDIKWDYSSDNWTVSLPFRFAPGNVGSNGASITFDPSGPFKITMPFSFRLADVEGALPIEWINASISATYTGEDFEFKFGVNNLLTTKVGASVGGWYDFMDNDLRMVVSYGGAYATEWFRASALTIGAITLGRSGDKDDRIANWWENIGPNGIAFRYKLSDLTVGAMFAGDAGAAMFNADKDGFMDDFLTQPTFGAMYTYADLGLTASTMLGFRNFDGDLNIVVHAGVKVVPADLIEGLSVNGDVALHIGDGDDINFYFGFAADYSKDGITGGVKVTGLDVEDDDDLVFTIGLGAKAGYSTDALPIGVLSLGVAFDVEDVNAFSDFVMKANVDYTGITFGDLSIGVGTEVTVTGDDGDFIIGGAFKPSIKWAVISNGEISFDYVLGAKDFSDGIDSSALTIAFKWSF